MVVEALIPLLAIALIFGFPVYVVKRRYDLKEKTLGDDGVDKKELEALRSERRLLQERVENLETIVTNVDFELNMRVARIAAAQSQLALPGGDAAEAAAASDASLDAASAHDDGPAPAGSERTLTAPGSMRERAQALRTATAKTPELEPGMLLADRYRIDRLLGRGGMGAVFLASDEVLGEHVAVKVISSMWSSDSAGLVDRFRREASAARKVSSPNVIRIHDLGETRDGLLYLSMEYFKGRTLAELLEKRGALDPRNTRDIVGQICDGLQAAHDAGVVHRDLKPQNVLVGERDSVKLIDFGLAKASFMTNMTATGLMLGTPHYMSPEQVRGKEVDARSDIYSLGALTYHVVTGRPPFDGDTPIAIGFAHCAEEPTPPTLRSKRVSAELERMILEALAKDPRDRPQSASEFRRAL